MLIIGIAGGSGSGKTTVVKKIINNFPGNSVAVLSQDSYYRDNSLLPLEERKKINFDHPNALEFDLLVEHLKDLRAGKTIQQPTYSYLTCTRQAETIPTEPKDVILVEGILILTHKALRELFDIKAFVLAADDERLMRIIERDMQERGRDAKEVMDRYKSTVKPMHQEFIEPSMQFADIIIPQGGKNKVAIEILSTVISNKLSYAK
ncbi:MAG TPA: uridine kinase [Bacteroidales bacterium]|nr:uridine kinase [Bacteroidales bacterium]